jgi:hypothetical protein
MASLAGTAPTGDRDMFKVCLTGGRTFSATTVGGTGFDTQLFLFGANGLGVYANDDVAGAGPSTLPAGHALTPNDPGVYYLAISHYPWDPVTESGANVFFNRAAVTGPTAAGLASPIGGWVKTEPTEKPGGPYTIFLTGTQSCIPPDQAAPEIQLRTPANGAVFARGEPVAADFDCIEEEGGSGLKSCQGTVADGQPIDTSTLGPKTFTVTSEDNLGNKASVTHTYTVVDRDSPLISLSSPVDGSVFSLDETVIASYSCSDEPGGSGLVSCVGTVPSGSPIDTRTVGPHTFTVNAADAAGNVATASATYTVLFDFEGFLPPVQNPPAVNRMKAGRMVPVKFSLDGYQGRKVIADGYPRTVEVACDSGQVLGEGSSARAGWWARIRYKPRRDLYVYLWKTDRRWAGSCRRFLLELTDGTLHTANFSFAGRPPRPPKPPKPPHDDDDHDDDD